MNLTATQNAMRGMKAAELVTAMFNAYPIGRTVVVKGRELEVTAHWAAGFVIRTKGPVTGRRVSLDLFQQPITLKA